MMEYVALVYAGTQALFSLIIIFKILSFFVHLIIANKVLPPLQLYGVSGSHVARC